VRKVRDFRGCFSLSRRMCRIRRQRFGPSRRLGDCRAGRAGRRCVRSEHWIKASSRASNDAA
jgi:hypothetical protein